jgi:hypothetical protein
LLSKLKPTLGCKADEEGGGGGEGEEEEEWEFTTTCERISKPHHIITGASKVGNYELKMQISNCMNGGYALTSPHRTHRTNRTKIFSTLSLMPPTSDPYDAKQLAQLH